MYEKYIEFSDKEGSSSNDNFNNQNKTNGFSSCQVPT